MDNEKPSEADLVVQRYRRRHVDDLYDPLRPEVCMALQERERNIIGLLRKHSVGPLRQLRVIEVGCGHGDNLLEFIKLGFDPAMLVGSELLPERAAAARRKLPVVTELHEGDAASLKLDPASFDIVYVSLVFSSLLSDDYQFELSSKMWNWLRPGGAILWYDFAYDNPWNHDVRGVRLKRIRELFPRGKIDSRRVTLAPPVARRVVPVHPALYTVLNAFVFCRTHVLCWISKQ